MKSLNPTAMKYFRNSNTCYVNCPLNLDWISVVVVVFFVYFFSLLVFFTGSYCALYHIKILRYFSYDATTCGLVIQVVAVLS